MASDVTVQRVTMVTGARIAYDPVKKLFVITTVPA